MCFTVLIMFSFSCEKEETDYHNRPIKRIVGQVGNMTRSEFSPNGKYLLFHSDKEGMRSAYLVDPKTSEITLTKITGKELFNAKAISKLSHQEA